MEVRESLYRHEIELPDDSHRKKIDRVKESILAMKDRTKILWDTILQRDVEFTVLRVVCTESTVRLSSIEEQLDSFRGNIRNILLHFKAVLLRCT